MSVVCQARDDSLHPRRNRFAALIDALRPVWRRFREYRERRDAFRSLLRLEDHMLADIGVSRSDVHWAARLPLSINASVELRKVADQRRRRR